MGTFRAIGIRASTSPSSVFQLNIRDLHQQAAALADPLHQLPHEDPRSEDMPSVARRASRSVLNPPGRRRHRRVRLGMIVVLADRCTYVVEAAREHVPLGPTHRSDRCTSFSNCSVTTCGVNVLYTAAQVTSKNTSRSLRQNAYPVRFANDSPVMFSTCLGCGPWSALS